MKKYTMLIFLFIFVIVFSGCKSIHVESSNDKPGVPLPPHLANCVGLNASATGECVRETYSNISLCEKLDDYWKDYCYTQNANIFQNSSVCEHVQDLGRKDNCYFSVAVKLAYTTKDPAYCNIINITNAKQDREECLWGLFIITKDSKICNLIRDELKKQDCVAYHNNST